ncbi:MAG: SDR family oxidoreductase [Rhodospirillales bacterium]|nr:SDR family oxidoreductase [Rhodospirillales bacterium]
MELGLDGKAAIVTGASRGIGAAIAVELAREGCDVMVAARSRDGLEATASRVEAAGRRAFVHAADLRDPNAPAALADDAASRLGRIDLVVCNAGATKRGDFLTLTDEDWEDGFALKFTAHRRLVRAAWPHLVRAGGNVVFISGIGGRTPGPEFAIGGSVNAAILSLAKALADKGIEDGVRVNVVNPGSVATDRLRARIAAFATRNGVDEAEARRRMLRESRAAGFGEPEDIAGLVAFITSRRGGFLHGSIIDMDGGQTKTI